MVGGGAIAAVGIAGGYFWSVRDGAYLRASRAARAGLGETRSASFDNLVRHAVAAANGHNSQPWTFREAPGLILIRPDFARRTPVVDPDDHHLYASLGCAAENLTIAAGAAGRSSASQFARGADGGIAIVIAPTSWCASAMVTRCPIRSAGRSAT